MNKEKEIKDISHLIIKHLSGEASPEEKERLEQWRNSSEANERLFQKLTALQGASKTYGHYRAAKEANDWLALRKKSHRKRASLLYRWMRYAAVACIIGIVGYYILNQHTGEKELPLATAIKPGVSKAILQLANGKEIFLDKQKKSQEILLGHYGISESESMLSYDKAEKIEEFHTLKVPQGGEYMLQLDGGSKVWVNAGSVIKYPVHFSTHERRVYLLEGEAYFEVARDEKRPFFVETSDVSVHVLGTGFNVSAYKEDRELAVTLAHGSVKVSGTPGNVVLKPDERFVLEKQSHSYQVEQVNARQICAWKEGALYFESMPLEDLTVKLARWFNCEFFFTSEELKSLTFSGVFRKYSDITHILSILEATTNIRMDIKGNTIVISYR